jgi:hypothetical protein
MQILRHSQTEHVSGRQQSVGERKPKQIRPVFIETRAETRQGQVYYCASEENGTLPS